MPATTNRTSVEDLNQANVGKLPEHIGLVVTQVEPGKVVGRFKVRQDLVAHTGYLLAGSLLSIADILCAYGVSTVWNEGSNGFTTVEVKCNFMGTLLEGEVECTAAMLHGGRSTQIWDATLTNSGTGKTLAVFRCTQMLLYPRA